MSDLPERRMDPRDSQRGQAMAEYGLTLAAVAAALVGTAEALGAHITYLLQQVAGTITGAAESALQQALSLFR